MQEKEGGEEESGTLAMEARVSTGGRKPRWAEPTAGRRAAGGSCSVARPPGRLQPQKKRDTDHQTKRNSDWGKSCSEQDLTKAPGTHKALTDKGEKTAGLPFANCVRKNLVSKRIWTRSISERIKGMQT